MPAPASQSDLRLAELRLQAASLPRAGFVSFNALAWLAWLYVYGYTGLLVGRAAGHPLIGTIAGLALGLPISGALGVGAHYGSAVGLLGIPLAIVLAIAGSPWLGLAFSAVPLALVLAGRASERRTGSKLSQLSGSLDAADPARLVEHYRYAARAGASGADELMRRVVERLSALGGPAVGEVVARYGAARTRRERTELIGLLGELRHPDGAPFLEGILTSQADIEVLRSAVAAAARAADPRLAPALAAILAGHQDDDLRARAAAALGSVNGDAARAALTLLLGTRGEGVPRLPFGVAFESVRSLGLIGSPAAIETLKSLASNPDCYSFLRWALEALSSEAARREVPWLSELALTHQDREVRGGAALALARTGTPAARDVLRRALEGDMASLEYSLVRAAGEAADAALLPRLIEIARGHPAWNMRAVAAAGVGRVDSTEARGALAGILGREKQPAVLERIVEASSAAWDAAFVPGLTSVAEREEESISSELRIRAIRALARIPGPEARAALEKLLALERRRGVLSRDRTVMSEISAALGIAVC